MAFNALSAGLNPAFTMDKPFLKPTVAVTKIMGGMKVMSPIFSQYMYFQ
jgi:hypothetical protein